MSNIQHFGVTSKGEDVAAITLSKGDISCKVLSFGATIQSLTVPDRKGQPIDIVLGYDSIREYETLDAYLGAVVGRYANRIAKGKFSLNGKEYSLAVNNGPNHLHGGIVGFSYKVWTIEDAGEDFVKLSLESADGEEAYPGNMKLTVKAGEVRLVEEAEKREKSAPKRHVTTNLRSTEGRAGSTELDIRGMMTDEADLVVDQFLDHAMMSRLNTVTIIHGKGTGALRKAVHQQLKHHPCVKTFRLGRYGEGEDGVTVVELRQ